MNALPSFVILSSKYSACAYKKTYKEKRSNNDYVQSDTNIHLSVFYQRDNMKISVF